jgi:hypothetical protein
MSDAVRLHNPKLMLWRALSNMGTRRFKRASSTRDLRHGNSRRARYCWTREFLIGDCIRFEIRPTKDRRVFGWKFSSTVNFAL